jgi:hypothetical protein
MFPIGQIGPNISAQANPKAVVPTLVIDDELVGTADPNRRHRGRLRNSL